MGAALALSVVVLTPARADAFATFSGGVLRVTASEGKIVPRCENDGELTVSGVSVENGPAFCRDLRRIEASSIVSGLFDFSLLPDNLGGGQGPIEIHATSEVTDPTEIANDKFIGAPGHINIFSGGLGFDSITGGNLNDSLEGGAESDKVDGGGGNDTIYGGAEGDKIEGGPGRDFLYGGAGADKLLGGPGSDFLKGGGGTDKLIGGPGRDTEKQ
jgi:RTX calcium-binding nonapeptide repeat (4 copies)